MPVDDNLPWPLLLSKLRRSNDSRVSYAEVMAARAEPSLLVRERVLEYGKADGYEPAGCEHGCVPNLDYATRSKGGLVGVACPQEPACWPGWTWVERNDVDALRCRAKNVFAALAGRNGLEPLTVAVPPLFVGVGLLRRRGLAVPVVWLRSATRGFEQLCRGLRAQLGHDGLVVLVAKDPRVPFAAADKIAVIELLDDARGDLRLVRALDELTPDYRTRVVTDQTLDLDYVRLRFATRRGKRHVVQINGHDFGGFRQSDVKFLRLLLLAAARKQGTDDGWLDKSRLRDGDDKDRALERMREDLVTYDLPGLSEAERKALIRTQKGKGTLRLGVPPENIEFDPSLAELVFVAPTTTVKKSGAMGKVTPKQEEGLQNAAVLLRDCRRLGVPGDVEAVKTPAKKGRSSRSSP
jgi:hypothetical protein